MEREILREEEIAKKIDIITDEGLGKNLKTGSDLVSFLKEKGLIIIEEEELSQLLAIANNLKVVEYRTHLPKNVFDGKSETDKNMIIQESVRSNVTHMMNAMKFKTIVGTDSKTEEKVVANQLIVFYDEPEENEEQEESNIILPGKDIVSPNGSILKRIK